MPTTQARPSLFDGSDKRKWVRHPPSLKATCRLCLGDAVAFWALEVRTVSIGGTTLLLDIPIPKGSELVLELYRGARRAPYRRTGRVTYVAESAGGVYVTGWQFNADLAYDEVEALL